MVSTLGCHTPTHDAPEDLKDFDLEGYQYNEALSGEDRPVFTRDSGL